MKYFCDLCGSEDSSFYFSNFDRMLKIKGDYSIYKCKKCGLLSIFPSPTREELNPHYNPNKYSVLKGTKTEKKMRIAYNLFQLIYYNVTMLYPNSYIFNSILNNTIGSFFRTVEYKDNGRILDIGCGIGYFLLVTKYLGMKSYGVEPGDFDHSLSSHHNLDIFNGTLLEAKYDSNFFDVITINHVLEHVNNPSEYLAEMYRILKPGGTLIIGVPISDGLAFKIFGKYWSQLDTPRHIYIFSKKNLESYAKKFGFKVAGIRYNSTPTFQFIFSFIYFLEANLGVRCIRPIAFNPIINILLVPLSNLLNILSLGDQCEMILIK